MKSYEGDVKIISTLDGGEINFNSGIVEMTQGFESIVYLLLFGGNMDDDGTKSTEKYEWWGNKLELNHPERKINSRFQNMISGLPATPANLKRLTEAARQDLAVLQSEKICDTIDITLTIPQKNRVDIEIVLLKDKRKLFETKYEANWGGQLNAT
jgi:hypothetical protein